MRKPDNTNNAKITELRKKGLSYESIASETRVSYGKVRSVARFIVLTDGQKNKLLSRDASHLYGFGRKKGFKTKKRVEMGEKLWREHIQKREAEKREKFRKKYTAEWWAQKRAALKERLLKYKGGKCILCGYHRCIASLVFHHRDPEAKEFIIGRCSSIRFEKVVTEVDKCDLLCHNCHDELHYNLNKKKRQTTGCAEWSKGSVCKTDS